MKRLSLMFLLLSSIYASAQVLQYVDPRIGSEGLGRTFVGACMPFGMAKPSPDCGTGNNAGWAPMPEAVSGFSQTHVSGTGGGPKYGNILVRPFSGADQHRTQESISPALYACTFKESGIRAEVTATRCVSFYRFTFPKGMSPYVEFDTKHFLGRSSTPKAREAQQFESASLSQPEAGVWEGQQTVSGGWNNGAPYTVYFHATAKPVPAQPRTYLVKVAISFVSIEQARKNMKAELKGWDFEATVERCQKAWEEMLGRVQLDDDVPLAQKRMFYTALYHLCLMPTERNEAGVQRPYDDYYAIWDTYRTSTPLLTLLAPARQTAIAQSLLDIYKQTGYMPDARSGLSNGRTQGGSNAEIVMADAMARGLQLDYELALEAMLKDATVPPKDHEAEGRGGLEEYNRLGYIPYGVPRAGNRTVEYSFCDWAIAQVAGRLGHSDIGLTYLKQSQRWKNLWRADYEHLGSRGFIMPRNRDGLWLDSIPYGQHATTVSSDSVAGTLRRHFHYTPDTSYEGPWYCPWWDCFMYEASSWEYSFAIPHDIPGLIAACGGKEAFERRLDTFFDHGLYNVANEPSFLTPCLYHYIGKPERSISRIKRIIQDNFNDSPTGLPGNDDGGAMSSWLACHMMGLYPLAGTDEWLLTEPLVSGLTLKLADGKTLRIQRGDRNAIGDSLLATPRITHQQLLQGSTLTLRANNPHGYQLTFKLHGQTRRFQIDLYGRTLHWSIVRNLRQWNGSFNHTSEAVEHATAFCYEQPLDRLDFQVPSNQLFCMISRDALREARLHSKCQFDGLTWMVKDKQDNLIHLANKESGAEMWVSDNNALPLVMEMKGNPAGFNWEMRERQ